MKLEDLTALNDEIGALARAGVPLGSGLLEMGKEMPSRLRDAAQHIGRRLEQGESFDEVLADGRLDIPEAYRAVLSSGVRSGRLAVAVEKLSGTLRRVTEARTMLKMAAVYPIGLVIAACCLFAFLIRPIHRMLYELLADNAEISGGMLQSFLWLVSNYGHWLSVIAAIIFIATWLWWVSASFVSDKSWFGRSVGSLPGVLRMRRLGSRAAFTEVLALLVEQNVPLHQALALAARTSGDMQIRRDAASLTQYIQRGQTGWQPATRHGIPPLLAWQLTHDTSRGGLAAGLRRLAGHYHAQVESMSYWLQQQLPIWLAGVIGGGIVTAYTLSSLFPWFAVLRRLGQLDM